ncbi:MAG TPA: GNAT family N-acetyltransferase, partial [Arcobacter sp.]|nr:GNAT family N-acetyltransferase [Arcobacter sp.]
LENHVSYIDSLSTKEDRIYFLVKDKNNNAIGVIDFTNISIDKADIGLYAKPHMKGVGKILMRTIIDYGFNLLKVKRLISEVFEKNKSAITLYDKFNFSEIGRRGEIITMELKHENR